MSDNHFEEPNQSGEDLVRDLLNMSRMAPAHSFITPDMVEMIAAVTRALSPYFNTKHGMDMDVNSLEGTVCLAVNSPKPVMSISITVRGDVRTRACIE